MYKDNLVIWGGSDEKNKYKDGAIYNIAKDCWTKIEDGPNARSGHIALFYKDEMLIWGGFDQNNKAYKNLDIFELPPLID